MDTKIALVEADEGMRLSPRLEGAGVRQSKMLMSC